MWSSSSKCSYISAQIYVAILRYCLNLEEWTWTLHFLASGHMVEMIFIWNMNVLTCPTIFWLLVDSPHSWRHYTCSLREHLIFRLMVCSFIAIIRAIMIEHTLDTLPKWYAAIGKRVNTKQQIFIQLIKHPHKSEHLETHYEEVWLSEWNFMYYSIVRRALDELQTSH